MNQGRLKLVLGLILGVSLAIGGCVTSKGEHVKRSRQIQPDDFAAPVAASEADQPTTLSKAMHANAEARQQQATEPTPPSESPSLAGAPVQSSPPADSPQPGGQSYPMAGMVGQVNGQAIYAEAVFEPIDEQLAALGRRLSRAEFEQQAGVLIARRLTQLVTDSLILGEAERDLSEQERMGLRTMMKTKREELLRQYGQGAPALAEANILRETGKTLQQTLDDYRKEVIVRRYTHQKLVPKVNVTRRDVERYYRDHYDDYNPAATRTVRLIRVSDAQAASDIQSQLEAGTAFAELAQREKNTFRQSSGGLMEDVSGDRVFGLDELNQAMIELDAGQHAGPIEAGGSQWFVLVESIDRPEQRSLKEEQRRIERLLWNQQFRELSDRYRQELYREGSYAPIEDMAVALVEIAMSQYAAAPSE